VTLLVASGVSVRYGVHIGLHATDLTVEGAEAIALVGRNGSGKSSLLRALAGVEPSASGTVWVQGQLCHHQEHRFTIAYVPQRAVARWELPVTVADIVATDLRGHGLARSRRSAAEPVMEALRQVDAQDLARRVIGTLSGGQAQRVLIARALVQAPHLLLLDEPFAGLDAEAVARLGAVIDRLRAGGMAIVCALHEIDLARRHFPRTLALVEGRVVQDGATLEVLSAAGTTRVFVPGAA
jgi:ABC-type Mn2+/Zn2+ transport system ATPase subunit